MKISAETTIAVIGLGYVGLPLAVEFGKKYTTTGFDLNSGIIDSYKKHIDPTGEVSTKKLADAKFLTCTSEPEKISSADFIIVAVPTPIDAARQPDLRPVKGATETAGRHMKKGAVVIFESTVYPGVTEDFCVPILEKESGLKWKLDFHVGYSPERINPGDKKHTLTSIIKVVSGDDAQTLEKTAAIYEAIVDAGVYKASSIKVAEAAKVIENTQRDLNIALMNELAVIFDRLKIDTINVLEAAGTKWNFLPFRPGLVGGHCIGVDPYYLTYKAETEGYHPEVILAGRRINDNMGKFIAEKTVKLMLKSGQNAVGARIGILGLTFKEDCPDLRNSKVVDIINELETYGIEVLAHDPRAEQAEALRLLGVSLHKMDEMNNLNALIIAVAHEEYRQKSIETFIKMLAPGGCLIDVKSFLDIDQIKKTDINFWRL